MDASLASVDWRPAAFTVAIRQLEVCVSQMVSPWLEDVMDEQDLWAFARLSFLPRVSSLEELIEAHRTPMPSGVDDHLFGHVWAAIRRQIANVASNPQENGYGPFAVTFLVSVMVLRQLIELEHLEAQSRFAAHSTNVAEAFLLQGFSKVGFRPFDVADGDPLQQLAEQFKIAAPFASHGPSESLSTPSSQPS